MHGDDPILTGTQRGGRSYRPCWTATDITGLHVLSADAGVCGYPPEIFLTRIIHQSQKPTEEGALGSRMILKTAVSPERHYPQSSASGCPALYQQVAWSSSGTMRPRSPLRLTASSSHWSPRRSQRSFPRPARLDARTPTRSNCASIPAPPGTTRATIP